MPTLKDVWRLYWRTILLLSLFVMTLTIFVAPNLAEGLERFALMALQGENILLATPEGLTNLGILAGLFLLAGFLAPYFAYLWHKRKNLFIINTKAIKYTIFFLLADTALGILLDQLNIQSSGGLITLISIPISIWIALKLNGD